MEIKLMIWNPMNKSKINRNKNNVLIQFVKKMKMNLQDKLLKLEIINQMIVYQKIKIKSKISF